jgi:hypothetical protein
MLAPRGSDTVGPVDALRRPHRRAVRPQGDGGLHLHAEAAPPGRRQDPRPFDRPVLASSPSSRWAARRSSAASASARWRSGRSKPTAPPTPAGNADGEVGRRGRPHQGLRGDRQGRRHLRGRHSGSFNVLVKEMRSLASTSSWPRWKTFPTMTRASCQRRRSNIPLPLPLREGAGGWVSPAPERRCPPLTPPASGRGIGRNHERPDQPVHQPDAEAGNLRPDPDRPGVAGAHPLAGPSARSRSRKRSTTAPSSRSVTACSARASSARSRTTSACAASTSA